MQSEILLPCSQNSIPSLQFHADYFEIYFNIYSILRTGQSAVRLQISSLGDAWFESLRLSPILIECFRNFRHVPRQMSGHYYD